MRFLITLLIIICIPLLAQSESKLDSMLRELPLKRDTTYLKKLLPIAKLHLSNGEPKKAVPLLKRGIAICDSLKNNMLLSDYYYQLGLTYRITDQYGEAIQILQQCYLLYEKAGNKKRMAYTQVAIGNVYLMLNNSDKMLEYYFQALEYFQKTKDTLNTAKAFSNIANGFDMKLQHAKSEEYYLKAIEHYKLVNHTAGIINSYTNLASMKMNAKDYSRALSYSFLAYNLEKAKYGKIIDFTLLNNFAEIYSLMGDVTNAMKWQKQAMQLAIQNDSKDYLSNTCRVLSDIFLKMTQYDSALHYKEKSIAYLNSIRLENELEQLTAMEESFADEQKNKELMALENDQKIHQLEIKEQKENIRNQKIFLASGSVAMLLLILLGVQLKRSFNYKQSVYDNLSELNKLILKEKVAIEERSNFFRNNLEAASAAQRKLLNGPDVLKKLIPNTFLIYIPKDIVSGDFLWIKQDGKNIFIACVDCTGHGVPGGLVSIHAHYVLENAFEKCEIKNPAAILNTLNTELKSRKDPHNLELLNIGMDLSIIMMNTESGKISYAGARSPVCIAGASGVTEIKPESFSLGDTESTYSQQNLNVKKGEMLYLFSDGYADQTGGNERKKFLRSNFRKIIQESFLLDPEKQKEKLLQVFESWKNGYAQVDDVQVVGLKINNDL
jgi:serine phosphatase RsbU (regulator of sigma subunit)